MYILFININCSLWVICASIETPHYGLNPYKKTDAIILSKDFALCENDLIKSSSGYIFFAIPVAANNVYIRAMGKLYNVK